MLSGSPHFLTVSFATLRIGADAGGITNVSGPIVVGISTTGIVAGIWDAEIVPVGAGNSSTVGR